MARDEVSPSQQIIRKHRGVARLNLKRRQLLVTGVVSSTVSDIKIERVRRTDIQ